MKMPIVLLFLKKGEDQDHALVRSWFDGEKSNLIDFNNSEEVKYDFILSLREVLQAMNRFIISRKVIIVEGANEIEIENASLLAKTTMKFDYVIYIKSTSDLDVLDRLDSSLEEFNEAQSLMNEGKNKLWDSYEIIKEDLIKKKFDQKKMAQELEKIDRAHRKNCDFIFLASALLEEFIL